MFIVQKEKFTLIKATSGGNIGTFGFAAGHAINNIFYATQIIFAGKEVEIIAVKPCNRSLNGNNSETLTEVLPGLFCATGFGGKGITDAAAFAYNYVENICRADYIKSYY